MKAHNPVHLRGEALIVGRDQRRAAFSAHEAEELGEHGIGRMLVKVAGWFIGQHEGRFVGKRPRDRDSLLLAARQL